MTPPLFIKVALLLIASAASALQFTAHPTMIHFGFTPSLDLRCSFTQGGNTGIISLVSMFISRSRDTHNIDYQEIASVNSFTGNLSNVAHGNATVSGFISNLGESYLSMHWTSPDDQEAGLYNCVANGVDGTGHPISVMSTSQVTSEVPSIIQMVQEILNLKVNMNNALGNNCTSGSWQTRLELMKNARFEISSLYKGRRYLLSKIADFVSAPVAQESCELYGGYLAEIEDDDELQFVQNFFKTRSKIDFKFVLIGGTDEGHENVWVYQRDGRAMTYTKWALGEPVGGVTNNCLFLGSERNWLMAASPCLVLVEDYNPRYLCEVIEE
ncbi:unnamed protein product [Lymnaea stagnalis]|uniref:C-type lectin domain-containing protein n=1 Tax=Lymnaea stagnalis TaxID=6523 RepID=A0AAV2HDJ5_LYMST